MVENRETASIWKQSRILVRNWLAREELTDFKYGEPHM